MEFCQYICGNIDNYSIIIYNTRNFFKYFSQRHLLQPLMVPVNLHCRYVAQNAVKQSYHAMHFFFLFIGWEPTTWPANNCLQIMVCSCVVPSKHVLLQIIFCSCVTEPWWQITFSPWARQRNLGRRYHSGWIGFMVFFERPYYCRLGKSMIALDRW